MTAGKRRMRLLIRKDRMNTETDRQRADRFEHALRAFLESRVSVAKPGDTVFLETPETISADNMAAMEEALQVSDLTVKVIVISGNMKVTMQEAESKKERSER